MLLLRTELNPKDGRRVSCKSTDRQNMTQHNTMVSCTRCSEDTDPDQDIRNDRLFDMNSVLVLWCVTLVTY